MTCPRIAVLGTDGAIGKRTTATILTRALNERGIRAVLVGTGQTGLIQGARYGVALDAIPCQFCSGEMEAAVVEAFEAEHPDVIIIEGQGALSHPAYLSSTFILRGGRPDAVILQHAPARRMLGDFPDVPTPTPLSEIALLRAFAGVEVIGLTINHEDMTDAEVSAAIILYELELGIPATDALTRPVARLVDMVVGGLPRAGGEADRRAAAGRRAGLALLRRDLPARLRGGTLARRRRRARRRSVPGGQQHPRRGRCPSRPVTGRVRRRATRARGQRQTGHQRGCDLTVGKVVDHAPTPGPY